ncbi:MAG TPA: SUMF1/EgtB/PvdO family nonheme iron enzyme [Polyangiaceae bacterium]
MTRRITELGLRVLAALSCMLLAMPPTVVSASETSQAARPLGAELHVLHARGSTMIRIAASDFWMGSTSADILDAAALCAREPLPTYCDPQVFADEQERHRVHLSAFLLDRREVSVEDYASCVRVGRCEPVPFSAGSRFARPDYPATFVTWYDASAYCAFRGARLPSEAEFERAARGVTGRRFPWGDDPSMHRANHGRLGIDVTDADDGYAELAPVGSFPAGRTPEGFLDLAGNAAEWVLDRYAAEYPAVAVGDPRGPDPSQARDERVYRGGSYRDALAWLRGAAREPMPPGERRPWLGFRCARSEAPTAMP